jgi:hypothetical protein
MKPKVEDVSIDKSLQGDYIDKIIRRN